MDETKLMLRRLHDLAAQREKYNYTTMTKFVGEKEQQAAARQKDTAMWGGYDGAERKRIAFYPDYIEPEGIDWEIAAVRITTTDGTKYTHRDYLGSLLGLGIGREVLGDILVSGGEATLFCLASIADYIADGLCSVSKSSVRCTVLSDTDFSVPERKFLIITGSVASCRIDSVLGVALGKSRSFCQELLLSGTVQLNHTEITDVSRAMKPGDLLSVRGFGRYLFDGSEHVTRKGRNMIKLRKFV